jgi:hypothetical protein
MTLLRPLPPIADNRNQFRVTVRAENKIFRLRSGVLCTGIAIATFLSAENYLHIRDSDMSVLILC